MTNRYIVQVKTSRNGRWESVESFDRLQEAINHAASESRAHEGPAKYRVWDEQKGEPRYHRGYVE